MIKNGDIIKGYTVMTVANGIALAHSTTAPDPYVVWRIDNDGSGVHSGTYTKSKEDAEWDFCCKAFPWFEDNAPVNMIDDVAEERITEFKDCLNKARTAIDMAALLVEDMVAERYKLVGKKEAPPEESTELEIDYLSSYNPKATAKIQSSVSDLLSKIKDEIKKSGIPCVVVIDNGLSFDVIKGEEK